MPQPLEPDDSSATFGYFLELRVQPTQHGHDWTASLEGTTSTGAALQRRDFNSLIDLMRFLEAMVAVRGLR